MTDNTKPSIKPVAAKKSGSQSKASSAQKKQGGNGLSLFVLLLLLIVTAVAAYGGFWFWQQLEALKSAQNNDVRQVNELRAKGAELQRLLDSAKAVRGEFRIEIAALDARVETVSDRSQGIAAQLATLKGTSQTDSLLNELAYFVKLAQRRLALTGDVNGAKSLLIYADEMAKDIEERGMVEVRKAIADDLTALSSADSVDVNGLYLRIDSLTPLISTLSLPPVNFSKPETEKISSEPRRSLTAGWEGSFKRAIDKVATAIANSFSFQKLDEPIQSLKSPEQRSYLQQNISLVLEQAQLGLLRGDQDVYSNSLSQARDWVSGHYRTDNAVGSMVLERLETLIKEPINPEVPSIDDSVNAVISFKEVWADNKIKRAVVKEKISRVQRVDEAPLVQKNVVKDTSAEMIKAQVTQTATKEPALKVADELANGETNANGKTNKVAKAQKEVPVKTAKKSNPKLASARKPSVKTSVEETRVSKTVLLETVSEKPAPAQVAAKKPAPSALEATAESLGSAVTTKAGELVDTVSAAVAKAMPSEDTAPSLLIANEPDNTASQLERLRQTDAAEVSIEEVEQSISEVEDSIRKLKASVKEAEEAAQIATSSPAGEER